MQAISSPHIDTTIISDDYPTVGKKFSYLVSEKVKCSANEAQLVLKVTFFSVNKMSDTMASPPVVVAKVT